MDLSMVKQTKTVKETRTSRRKTFLNKPNKGVQCVIYLDTFLYRFL